MRISRTSVARPPALRAAAVLLAALVVAGCGDDQGPGGKAPAAEASAAPSAGLAAEAFPQPESVLGAPSSVWTVRASDLSDAPEAELVDTGWTYASSGGMTVLPDVVAAGVSDDSGLDLVGLDPESGEEMWRQRLDWQSWVSCVSLDAGAHLACWGGSGQLDTRDAATGELVGTATFEGRVVDVTGWGEQVFALVEDGADGQESHVLHGGSLADPFGGWEQPATDGGLTDRTDQGWSTLATDGEHVFAEVSGGFTTLDLGGSPVETEWTSGTGEGAAGVGLVAVGDGDQRIPLVAGRGEDDPPSYLTSAPDWPFTGRPWGVAEGVPSIRDGLFVVNDEVRDAESGIVVRSLEDALGAFSGAWAGRDVLAYTPLDEVDGEFVTQFTDVRSGEALWHLTDSEVADLTDGLTFSTATDDAVVFQNDEAVRVLDSRTGEQAWEQAVDATGELAVQTSASALIASGEDGIWGFAGFGE